MSTIVCVVWLPRVGELNQVMVEFVRSSGIEFARIGNISPRESGKCLELQCNIQTEGRLTPSTCHIFPPSEWIDDVRAIDSGITKREFIPPIHANLLTRKCGHSQGVSERSGGIFCLS